MKHCRFRYQWNWLRAGDMNDPTAYAWTLGEQETIVKPDHQYVLHLGYERAYKPKQCFSKDKMVSFRYPNIDERVGSLFKSKS